MSNDFKQDVIKAVGKDRYIQSCKEIAQMYDDVERDIYSNIPDDVSTELQLSLYNVQFDIKRKSGLYLINKFVYAVNEIDAKQIVAKRYLDYNADTTEMYCQKVDIRRGLMFSV